ncbi:MAG TPA: hypothetical protein VG733_05395, partial [Chthoniobacteraceae bacterium]|nr:hypothetical protein [Chthoniobacteraceae bacterium]
EHIRMSFSPENPRTGDTVFLLATVFDNNGFPIDKGNVSAQVAAPDGSSEHIDLTPVPGGWGVYKTDFVPRVGGKFEVTVSNDPGGQKITAPVLVEQPTVEKVGQPGNFAVLREMSEITHGAAGNTSQLDEIVKRISLLPEPKPVEKRFRLWSEWWSGATLVFLLAGYWTFRKLSGMV